MKRPLCLNFRVITANILDIYVKIQKFTFISCSFIRSLNLWCLKSRITKNRMQSFTEIFIKKYLPCTSTIQRGDKKVRRKVLFVYRLQRKFTSIILMRYVFKLISLSLICASFLALCKFQIKTYFLVSVHRNNY